jgi:hypothetical protein
MDPHSTNCVSGQQAFTDNALRGLPPLTLAPFRNAFGADGRPYFGQWNGSKHKHGDTSHNTVCFDWGGG